MLLHHCRCIRHILKLCYTSAYGCRHTIDISLFIVHFIHSFICSFAYHTAILRCCCNVCDDSSPRILYCTANLCCRCNVRDDSSPRISDSVVHSGARCNVTAQCSAAILLLPSDLLLVVVTPLSTPAHGVTLMRNVLQQFCSCPAISFL